MAHFLIGYLMVAGGVTAGLQVARGMVRGTGRMLAGDMRGALSEVVGGVVAPARQAYREACKLTTDVLVAATVLTDDEKDSLRATERSPEPRGWERDGVLAG